jgi:ubiquinone/menaquinone biosynthesis C-methylase UbiE
MVGVNYDRVASDYEATRGGPLEALESWRRPIACYLPAGSEPIVDVGAGTGIWVEAFTAWFDASVLALEPSLGMCQVALTKSPGASARYVIGTAEAIPMRDSSARAAWISTVIHHIDMAAAARELRRVLLPSSPVLVRNPFPGRHEEIDLFRYFTGARRVAERFPSVDAVVETFGRASFRFEDLVRVREASPGTLQDMRASAVRARHVDSVLAPLSDSEFADGLSRIDTAILAGEPATPLGIDLLVLRMCSTSARGSST